MPGTIDLGDNYQVEEDENGDWIVTDENSGNVIQRWDDDVGRWVYTTDAPIEIAELIDGAGISHTGELADLADVVGDHGSLTGLGDDDHTQYLLVDGTRAMSGALDMGSNAISNVTDFSATGTATVPTADTDAISNQDYNETVQTLSGSGTLTVDLSTANLVRVEATGDVTIEFSNVTGTPPGNSLTIYFEDSDGSGPHTITWPSSVVWSGGTAEDTVDASDNLEVSLLTDDGGTEWRARRSGRRFA